ncbi:MAG: hypothetical protein PUP90_24720 [Nostoc sp. S4]|nr:hypothetical protein [Nostoc sp. S4]
MTYEQLKSLKPKDLKRLCDKHPKAFNQMLKVVRCLRQAMPTPSLAKQKTGRPTKLSLEDQLLNNSEVRIQEEAVGWTGSAVRQP